MTMNDILFLFDFSGVCVRWLVFNEQLFFFLVENLHYNGRKVTSRSSVIKCFGKYSNQTTGWANGPTFGPFSVKRNRTPSTGRALLELSGQILRCLCK